MKLIMPVYGQMRRQDGAPMTDRDRFEIIRIVNRNEALEACAKVLAEISARDFGAKKWNDAMERLATQARAALAKLESAK